MVLYDIKGLIPEDKTDVGAAYDTGDDMAVLIPVVTTVGTGEAAHGAGVGNIKGDLTGLYDIEGTNSEGTMEGIGVGLTGIGAGNRIGDEVVHGDTELMVCTGDCIIETGDCTTNGVGIVRHGAPELISIVCTGWGIVEMIFGWLGYKVTGMLVVLVIGTCCVAGGMMVCGYGHIFLASVKTSVRTPFAAPTVNTVFNKLGVGDPTLTGYVWYTGSTSTYV